LARGPPFEDAGRDGFGTGVAQCGPDSSTVGATRLGLIARRGEATGRTGSRRQRLPRLSEKVALSLCDTVSRFDDLGGYCAKGGTLPGVRHRSRARGCSPSLFSVGEQLQPTHRPQIVATAFRTSSTAPRIVAITTTTAAARHTARMSFSMSIRSGLLARSPFQEQALRSNGRGAPGQSTTPRFVRCPPRLRLLRALGLSAQPLELVGIEVHAE